MTGETTEKTESTEEKGCWRNHLRAPDSSPSEPREVSSFGLSSPDHGLCYSSPSKLAHFIKYVAPSAGDNTDVIWPTDMTIIFTVVNMIVLLTKCETS